MSADERLERTLSEYAWLKSLGILAVILIFPIVIHLLSTYLASGTPLFKLLHFAGGLHVEEKYFYLLVLGSFLVGALAPLIAQEHTGWLRKAALLAPPILIGASVYLSFSVRTLLNPNGWLLLFELLSVAPYLLGIYLGGELSLLKEGYLESEASKLGLLIFAFSAACLATSLVGISPLDSLRETGVILLASASWIVAAMIGSNLRGSKELEDVIYMSLSLILITSLILAIVLVTINPGVPFSSFFFQQDIFSSYLLLLLPFLFAKVVEELRNYVRGSGKLLRLIMYLASISVAITILIMTFSRASILALLLATPLYVRYLLERLRGIAVNKQVLYKVGAVGLLILLLIFSLTAVRLRVEGRAPLKMLTGKFKAAATISDTSSNARLDFWTASLKLAMERPLTGLGLYSYSFAYPKYQTSFLFYSKDPHNYYLQLLAETGILGFIAFTLLLLVTLIRGFLYLGGHPEKLRRSLQSPEGRLLAVSLIAILQEAVKLNFDVDFKFAAMILTFFIILGLAAGLIPGRGSSLMPVKGLWLLLLALILTFAPINLRLTVETKWLSDREALSVENLRAELRLVQPLLRLAPYNYRARIELVKAAIGILSEEDESFLRELRRLEEEAERWSPLSLGGKLYMAVLELRLRDYKAAISYALQVIKDDPYNLPIAYEIVLASLKGMNMNDVADRWARHVLHIFPPEEIRRLMKVKRSSYASLMSIACERLVMRDDSIDYNLIRRCLNNGDVIDGTSEELISLGMLTAFMRRDGEMLSKLCLSVLDMNTSITLKVRAYIYLAWVFHEEGRDKEAVELLDKISSLLPRIKEKVSKEDYELIRTELYTVTEAIYSDAK